MKKLIVAMAAIASAICAQAYNVNWGATNVRVPIADNLAIDQTGIVTTSANAQFAAGALSIELYWVASDGTHNYIDTFATTGNGAVSAQTIAAGTDAPLYQAMLADHGSAWKPEYYMTATYTVAEGVYTYEGTAVATKALSALGTGNILATANLNNAGSWSYAANIPEPTSGLLLLLGMAGLALKRKVA